MSCPSVVPLTAASCDPAIIAALRAGDANAFGQLHAQYAKKLITVAARGTDSVAIAEELVQDAFFRMWVNRERLMENGSPVGYLYRTVRRRVWNYHRHCRVEHASAQRARIIDGEPVYEPHLDVDNGIDAVYLRNEVLAVVDELPHQMRVTYRLLRLENLTYAEAARRMGLSVKTVEMHMTRALKVLRVRLERIAA
jgi:RNA polymerase sigma-70 factor (ECF subfamily)